MRAGLCVKEQGWTVARGRSLGQRPAGVKGGVSMATVMICHQSESLPFRTAPPAAAALRCARNLLLLHRRKSLSPRPGPSLSPRYRFILLIFYFLAPCLSTLFSAVVRRLPGASCTPSRLLLKGMDAFSPPSRSPTIGNPRPPCTSIIKSYLRVVIHVIYTQYPTEWV